MNTSIGLLCAALVGIGISLGISSFVGEDTIAKSVSSEEFLLRDASGRIYARLAIENQRPVFEFIRGQDGAGLTLTTNGGNGALVVRGKNGKVIIHTYPMPEILIADTSNAHRVRMRLEGGGRPEISLLDKRGRARAYLRLDSDSEAIFGLAMDKELIPESGIMHGVVRFIVNSDGNASLHLQSEDGLDKKRDDVVLVLGRDGKVELYGADGALTSLRDTLR